MLKIAIVEDERECQEALIEHLRKYEKEKNEAFIVRIFNDGIDILDDYSADYDLIFLDIHMKYQDGMTTAKRIREVDADAQIVFITALAQYAIEGYKVNALDFILKPVVYEQLAMTMDKVLAVPGSYHLSSLLSTISSSFLNLYDFFRKSIKIIMLTSKTCYGVYAPD